MLIRRVFSLLFVSLVCCFQIYAQRSLSGTVTAIIDGKTVLVDSSGTKLNVRLRYIDVPESEQQLFTIVKDHLAQLILNKTVTLREIGNFDKYVRAQVFLGDVDISQQMIRDGAAWHSVFDEATIEANEQKTYADMEDLAKSEKRGIWGINGLKTPWEFRLEKEAQIRTEEAKREAASRPTRSVQVTGYTPEPKKVTLPPSIPETTYMSERGATPRGYIVVAVGSTEKNPEKLLKAVKKPQVGDVVCSGYEIPSSFTAIQMADSPLCPSIGFGNNASLIGDAKSYSRSLVKSMVSKLYIAYRTYQLGHPDEFRAKAQLAINVVDSNLSSIADPQLKNNLFMATQALKDAMTVRRFHVVGEGSMLDSDTLLIMADRYNIGNASELTLDDRIIEAGWAYLNDISLP